VGFQKWVDEAREEWDQMLWIEKEEWREKARKIQGVHHRLPMQEVIEEIAYSKLIEEVRRRGRTHSD
jgi:hypothetical protein